MLRRPWLLALLVALASPAGASSLDLPVRGAGISFGNSTHFSGIRFNTVDHDVEDLNGLGLTLWKPRASPDGRMRGLYVGLYGQRVEALDGIGLGVVGTSAQHGRGIFVGGLGLAFGAEKNAPHPGDAGASGILLAGLGIGGETLRGIAFAGLGIGAETLRGVMLAGLGIGGDSMTGIAIAGLGMGADTVRGIGIGGLGIGGDSFTGIGIGGLGLGANHFKGIGVGGLGVGADTLHGVVLGGLGCGADEMRGFAFGGLMVKAGDLSGAAVSAYTRVRGTQHGIAIGLVNITHVLHGVQLGVLNYAGNNPAPFKLLPVLNVNLSDS